MTDDPEEGGFNPSSFFEQIRKSASVKAGAIMFGQAQVAYYDTLKESGMSDEEAYNMLAHTTASIVRGVFSAAPGVLEVVLKIAMAWEGLQEVLNADKLGGKEVPGSGTPE